ncbi:hypothetical protein EG329_000733 [Mollisiaceae sp. DMI_Dod_QoI]|nr:hypothetical protein EG329_000733 [Helotiales sp. DMI_Dod_QoI]
MRSTDTFDRGSARICLRKINGVHKKQFFCVYCDSEHQSARRLYLHQLQQHRASFLLEQCFLLKRNFSRTKKVFLSTPSLLSYLLAALHEDAAGSLEEQIEHMMLSRSRTLPTSIKPSHKWRHGNTNVDIALERLMFDTWKRHVVFEAARRSIKQKNVDAQFEYRLCHCSRKRRRTLLRDRLLTNSQNDKHQNEHTPQKLFHDHLSCSGRSNSLNSHNVADTRAKYGVEIDPHNLPDFSSSNGMDIPLRLQGITHNTIGDFNVTGNIISMDDAIDTIQFGAKIIEYNSASADREPPVYRLQLREAVLVPKAYVYLLWQTTTSPEIYKEERFEIIETCQSPIMGAEFLRKTGIYPQRGPNQGRFEEQPEVDKRIASGGFTEVGKHLRHTLPMSVNGHLLSTLIDTGSSGNFISMEMVLKLGLKVNSEARPLFELADGSRIESTGQVFLTGRLGNDTRFVNAKFDVIDGLDEYIVFGNSFLRQHKIMTRNRDLLKVVDDRNISDYVPGQKYSMPIYLNGERADGILDPGHFGGNAMSLAYALKNHHLIDTSNCPDIELAGGKFSQKSEGVVTIDAFHLGRPSGAATSMEFTVVRDWSEDITIGNHTIMSTRALSRQYEAYRETQEPEIIAPIFGSSRQLKGGQAKLLSAVTGVRDVLREAGAQLSTACDALTAACTRLEEIDRKLGLPGLRRRDRRRLDKDRERQEKAVREAELEATRAQAMLEESRDAEDNLHNAGIDS